MAYCTCNIVSCSAGVRGVLRACAAAGVTEYSLNRALDAFWLSSTDNRAVSLAWPILTICHRDNKGKRQRSELLFSDHLQLPGK